MLIYERLEEANSPPHTSLLSSLNLMRKANSDHQKAQRVRHPRMGKAAAVTHTHSCGFYFILLFSASIGIMGYKQMIISG